MFLKIETDVYLQNQFSAATQFQKEEQGYEAVEDDDHRATSCSSTPSGTTTTDANSHLHQRPLLAVDEVITP